jgi:iron complex transport system ATP-binding protein
MIELQNLSCFYEDELILKDITHTFSKHLSIMGANGSGKSTLAKTLCNLNTFSGKILLDGKEVERYSAKERAKKIAYIPTKLDLYDTFLTVKEFVLLGRFAHKESFFDYTETDRALAHDAIELFGLKHLADQTLHSLSSGESALVLIAQALTQQSQIIIFDEPTANLDPKNAKIIAQHIKDLKQTHTIVLITHDLHLAAFIDNPVLFLKNRSAHYFQNDFFTDENLSRLYDVSIRSLEVVYD